MALVEKEDFGYGTTSRSTRLIHGGLRYLELYDFGLVRQGLKEREILLRTAPHLVHGLPFLTPVYAGDRWSLPLVKAGMLLYDLLSWGKSLPAHRMLSRRQVLAMEPGLRSEGLRGGALYYDGQVNFPERLGIECLLCAGEQGARAANHAVARCFLREGDRVVGVEVEDRLTGAGYPIRARLVVNAAGPWADEVARWARPDEPGHLRRTKGIHLVVPSFSRHAVVLQSRRDGRIFFAVPWNGFTLVGTTDTDFEHSPDSVRAEPDEIAYLVEETRRVFPQAEVGRVHYTMAGVRALVRSKQTASESAVSRKHLLVDHADAGMPGLLSVFGGKITEYRSIAEEAADLAARRLGNHEPSRTAREPLYGGGQPPAKVRETLAPRAAAVGLEPEQLEHLVSLYGTRAAAVLALAEAEPELGRPITPDSPDIRAQIRYAVTVEMARSASDFLLRRTGLGFRADRGVAALETVSREMALLLEWTPEEARADRRQYEEIEMPMRA